MVYLVYFGRSVTQNKSYIWSLLVSSYGVLKITRTTKRREYPYVFLFPFRL